MSAETTGVEWKLRAERSVARSFHQKKNTCGSNWYFHHPSLKVYLKPIYSGVYDYDRVQLHCQHILLIFQM